MQKKPAVIIFGAIIFFLASQSIYAQYYFQDTPLLHIIETVENESDYRFLYRESQLADINLSFRAHGEEIIDSLRAKLSNYHISLESDSSRNQIILYKQKIGTSKMLTISGQVVDAETGERLPYATLFWETRNTKNGVAANSSGAFKISSPAEGNTFTFTGSYLGYQPNQVSLDLTQGISFEDITLRLNPITVKGNDIVVTGLNHPAGSDSIYRNFVNVGVLNPFGENNTARALQSLPSVSSGTAINNGINVRGSSSDATQILLDGITIYNQSHLFGLLDSFNPSALQTSGFFYDVTPAQFQSSPGGTLAMLTKTGSLNNFTSSAGLSNTAFNATLNAPLVAGKSSWLLSGRSSYMNTLNWLGNDELIAYGLNIDRPKEVIGKDITDLDSRLVFPGEYDAAFFDLHGKMYFEFDNGSRLITGAYYGADNVSQEAERLVRRFNPDKPEQRFSRVQMQTLNEWGNLSGSLTFKTPVTPSLYSHTMAAASIYNTEFSKDDFVYNRIERNTDRVEVFTFPLRNQSVFNEFKFDQSFDLILPKTQWTFGASFQYFLGEYFEESFDRPGFFISFESGLADIYSQLDYTDWEIMNVHLGSRLHYYTNGNYLYFSPRIKLKFFNEKPVSFGLGYSRNFQFTHRLSFYNVSSPDVWVISSKEQPPASSDYFTAGVYFRGIKNTLFQVEGYHKYLTNARLFEINAQTLTNSFDAPPWLYNNDGLSKGVEILIKNQFKKLSLTNSYALSSATFQNPAVLNGSEFHAEWDRTHSFNSTTELKITSNLTTFVGFTAASGVPNRLHFLRVEEQQRLNNYYRVDAGLEYNLEIGQSQLEMNISVFNVLDQQNTWYRELDLVIDSSVPTSQQRLTAYPVDVYDLGIQPSFNVMIWF
ncbi:MAG: TonB-dependent receptor [Gracilimonas sp.]|uniref:TonB-dependent receptor n=1 Tax=Gracilimonas sp. TaxID=1974203 RepID=UPI001988E1CC|nr:TonB-dependent receptor [Gracilimonas sp.]MBD3615391.1 TonB-dependent receptor [Gracilimonas sp.]